MIYKEIKKDLKVNLNLISKKMPKQTPKKRQASKKKEIKISAANVAEEVRKLMKGGNVERIIIKGPKGGVLLEIPVSAAAVKKLFAPILAAVGAATALVKKCTIVIEKK